MKGHERESLELKDEIWLPNDSQSWLLARLTDVRQLWVVLPLLLAYQGWAKPWPIDRGYSAVANLVDVTGTVQLEFKNSVWSP